jgi:hypothetical protein
LNFIEMERGVRVKMMYGFYLKVKSEIKLPNFSTLD